MQLDRSHLGRGPRHPHKALLGLLLAALGACSAPGLAPPVARTETASLPEPVATQPRAVAASTAHPLATRAALQMLAQGGSAIDATIAAQMVLGLVEPQSSGIGGGLLMLVWDAQAQRVRSYDGLAAAPARSTASLRTDVNGKLLPLNEVSRGGRSVGVPGALAALEMAHGRHGKLPWSQLFQPAIRLATEGYPLAGYAHGILQRDPGAKEHPEFRADHFDAQGQVLPVGTPMQNPAYAQTLREIAAQGAAGFWRNGGAARLVAAAQRGTHASLMTVDDILRYQAKEREPLCAPLRSWKVCVMGPPSFGGVTVLQQLSLLDARAVGVDPSSLGQAAFWHLYAESGRLAQADRRHYVGDPDHVTVPLSGLLAPRYLQQRAALIDPLRAAASVRHGEMARSAAAAPSAATADAASAETSADQTSQIVVVDAGGTIASTTTTINLNFGSRLRVDGYVLNNALTNFAGAPEGGGTSANQMAPGKRPVTSMAPVIVFDSKGQPVVAGGSAGGGQIVDYIARALLELLWLDGNPAQVLAGGHVTTALAPRIQLEAGTPREALAAPLKALGHDVIVEPTVSGAGFIKRVGKGWLGAADPRRDGVALGQ